MHPILRNISGRGVVSLLYSCNNHPLQMWDKKIGSGRIKRINDEEIESSVLELINPVVSQTYITCLGNPMKSLGVKLPFLVMILKNLNKHFVFEIQIIDDKDIRRRFRAINFQSTTRVQPFVCQIPLKLDEGWNEIEIDLAKITKQVYQTNYVETLRVQVHANCLIRRVYFTERLFSEDDFTQF